ncbi:hypothetical protein DVH24_005429 [Malus domestica]|uniref:Uncharacterized protein n=1 Tax=Malus domestica TaxID=3750 RepID=A0A498KJQ0_MALDO|nr:hypothetical protein DVH24_005429 [Malus domestica]
MSLSRKTVLCDARIDHMRGQCLEGGRDNPKRSACGPGREDEGYCTGLTDVRPPNPDANT